MTPDQLRLIHIAKRQAHLDDAAYRLILRNLAQVASSKQLSNTGFEDVMACFEERGFRMAGQAADYFRNKVKLRGTFAGERIVFKIHELIAGSPYTLPGLCFRFSQGRTREVSKLNASEAHNLVEMLKSKKSPARPCGARTQPVTEDAHAYEEEPF